MITQAFLFELGCEELPPKSLEGLASALTQQVEQGLKDAGLGYESIVSFATPRRLAFRINALEEQQPDKKIERRGPALQAAFDTEGNPTKAAEGFAKGLNVDVNQLQRLETDKGSWLYYEFTQPGLKTLDLMPGIIDRSLQQLPIAKRMRWGSSRTEFVRPAHWVVMLYGNQVVPATLLGKKADRLSRGHRFHGSNEVRIKNPESYEACLNEAHVIVSISERKQMIQQQIDALTISTNAEVLVDPDLLAEVTALVEWPVAMTGHFEERFLDVPAEALISSMQEHQKYFPVVNETTRKLLPHFVFISNIASKQPEAVVEGNERVIRPRLADAAFFWDTDRKKPLESRVSSLGKVLFQKQLGTLLDKTERVQSLSGWLAEQFDANPALAKRAARLSKADLVSEMVFEFDDMQGIAGRYYAEHDGEPAEVATAIQEHYQPKHAGDNLPNTQTGQILALADRLDTLVGIFGIGQLPTGTKDPFGLRRASFSVLRILVEKGLDLDLKVAINKAIEGYQAQGKELPQNSLEATLLNYMLDRFGAWYQDQHIPVEVFQAVRARQLSNPLDIDLRVKAVYHFYQQPSAQALASATKRVGNLLNKAEIGALQDQVNVSLFETTEEQALFEAIQALSVETKPLFEDCQYQQALDRLSSLRPAVDNFFDKVMVMVDEESVRNNRLALLTQLRNLFLHVAEISHLQAS